MQEENIRISGSLQHFHGDLERGQHLDLARYLIFLSHGRPDVGIDHIRALQAGGVAGYFNNSACLRSHLS
jgi:hypothetical protein